MSLEIQILGSDSEDAYSELVNNSENAMFYHSLKYRHFLQSILIDSVDHYLIAFESGIAVASIPLFAKASKIGTVVNSLPFYGSHGSLVFLKDTPDSTKLALIEAYFDFCRESKALSATIIENIFSHDRLVLESQSIDYVDERISQITTLPKNSSELTVDADLMNVFHSNTRNAITKGFKSGLIFNRECSTSILRELHGLHTQNIESLGGISKPWDVISEIENIFEYTTDYDLYTARNDDGVMVSGLLVFYFKDTVEYYLPATDEKYRNQQPLSAIIFLSMKHAVLKRKSRYWNWGGTWLTQDGVHLFKSRWGATDLPYKYYTKEFSEKGRVLDYSRSFLLETFPHYYVIPFSKLK
jgi:hypothetical protein